MERKYRFISNRILKNGSGKETGRMRVLVKTGSDTAEVDYKCPECGSEKHLEQEWKRPFSVKCRNCGNLMKLPRLKDQMKKEKKKR